MQWLTTPFGRQDLSALAHGAAQIPGFGPRTAADLPSSAAVPGGEK
ncbi:hypothetical protein [Streptomyces shenzhenensis]|nr:hypothetical protein [Streptomyces shenzhenensis]